MTATTGKPLTPDWRTIGRCVYLYRLYDQDGALLYIGITSNLRRRRSTHRGQSPWFPQVAGYRIQGPFTWRGAEKAERAAILAESPRHNKCIDQAAHARASKIPGASHDKCCVPRRQVVAA